MIALARRAYPIDFVDARDARLPCPSLAAFGRAPSRLRHSAGGFGEAGRAAPGWGGRTGCAEVPEGGNPPRVPITTVARR
jgi:hypothetical protein